MGNQESALPFGGGKENKGGDGDDDESFHSGSEYDGHATVQRHHTEDEIREYSSSSISLHDKSIAWKPPEKCVVCGKDLKGGHFNCEEGRKKKPSFEVAIVGGGIVGTSLAYFLGLAGVNTCIIEREFVGAGASSMSAGTIWCPTNKPLPYDSTRKPRLGKLCERYIPTQVLCSGSTAIIKSIDEKYDVDYRQPGSISVSTTLAETAALVYEYFLAKSLGFEVQILAGHDLRVAEPRIAPNVWAGLYFPLSGYVDPSKLTHGLAQAAIDTQHVTVMEETHITGIEKSSDGEGHCIRTKCGKEITSQHVVLANGVWVNGVAKWFGLTFPVVPVKGQIFLTEELPPERLPKKIIFCLSSALYWASHHTTPAAYITHSDTGRVFCNHYYGRPTVDGAFMFGGLRMACPIQDYSVFENYAEYSLSAFQKLYPSSSVHAEQIEGSWSGLMPFTPTGKLFLGEVRERVWIANGFGPSGIMKSPKACEILSKEIVARLRGAPVDPKRRFAPGEYIN